MKRGLLARTGPVSAALLTIPVAALLPAGPASAASASVSAPASVVLYSECQNVSFSYSISIDPGASSWSFSVGIADADGQSVGFSSNLGSATSGTAQFSLCGLGTRLGTHQVVGTGQETMGSTSKPFSMTPVPIALVAAPTRTTLSATRKKRSHDTYLVKIRTEEGHAAGYAALADVFTRLERYDHGRWTRLRVKSRTGDAGTARIPLVVTGRERLRVVLAARGNLAGSVSNVLRLPRRR